MGGIDLRDSPQLRTAARSGGHLSQPTARVDTFALAAEFQDEILNKSGLEDKPWGIYEFAVSDPDETLVRVGWPTRLRQS
jgi:hypothetical protein